MEDMNSHEPDEPGERPVPPSQTAWNPAGMFDWAMNAALWAGQAHLKLFEGLMAPRPEPARGRPPSPWNTTNAVALDLPSMQLRDFSTAGEGPATLICAPYALHGATIADLAPGHSVVEKLRGLGLARVFVTDWRSATPEMRYFTIDTYLADLNVAVDRLGPPVDLIGLCQGGWLALVYAARFPEKVRRLVLVGAPVDIAVGESHLSRFVSTLPLAMFEELVRTGEGIVHGERTLAFWGMPTHANDPEAVLQFSADVDAARRRELGDRFRRWYAETVDLPGVFYLQVVQWLFRENRISEGKFVALGERIDLTRLRAPIFLLAASQDEVVPERQLFATARLVGTSAAHLESRSEPCGHLALFLGAAVLDRAWPRIADWLGCDLEQPRTDKRDMTLPT